jgi:hypothetical protein
MAAFFLAFAAVLPIGSWLILLFTARPASPPLLEAVASQLSFTFSAENSDRWWFVLWAALPIILLLLASAYFFRLARTRNHQCWLFSLSCTNVLVSPLLWPSLLLPLAAAAYYAYLCLRDA